MLDKIKTIAVYEKDRDRYNKKVYKLKKSSPKIFKAMLNIINKHKFWGEIEEELKEIK